MIIVTGNTFDNRDLLKSMGGQWNNADRNWQFSYLSDDQIAQLKALVGVFVTSIRNVPPPWALDNEPPAPRAPTQHFGDDQSFFNYFEDQDPTAFFGFSSLHAFADYVDNLPITISRHRAGGWSTDEDGIKFTGTQNMAEALELARHGWTDGLGITGMLTVDAAQARRRVRSVTGGTVNVGRMLAGDPRHMVKRPRQPGHRNIRLFVQTIMWRGIGASIAMFRAMIIAAMVDLLEREGYRCEIIAVACTTHDHDYSPQSQLTVRIKDAGERLDLLDVSFALGHPSFTRRLFFAANECVPECHPFEKSKGLISTAFSDEHPCGPNEFYIPQIFGEDALRLGNDPMKILPFIEPEGLPIKIKRIE